MNFIKISSEVASSWHRQQLLRLLKQNKFYVHGLIFLKITIWNDDQVFKRKYPVQSKIQRNTTVLNFVKK